MVHQPQDEETGTAAGSRRRKARKPRRWRRLLLIAVLIPLLLYASREYTLHPLGVRCAPWLTARLTPYQLTLTDIDGDWFTGLQFEGLRLQPLENDATLRGLSAEELEVHWSLLALLRGEERWLGAVRVVGVDGEFVLGKNDAPETDAPASALPLFLPVVDVERLSLSVRLTDGSVIAVSDASFSVAAAQTIEANLPLTYSNAAGAGRAHTVDVALTWGAAEVEVQRMTVDGVGLVQAGSILDLRQLHEGRIQWDVSLDIPAERARTSGVLEESMLRADLDFARMDLTAMRAYLSGLVPNLPEDLSGSVTVKGELTVDLDELRPTGSLTILAADIVAAGRRLTRAELRATADGQSAGVTRLEAQAPGGRIQVDGLSVSLANLELDAILASLVGTLVVDVDELGEFLHGARLAELPPLLGHHLDVRVRFEGGAAHFDTGRLDVAGGHVDLTGGSVALFESVAGGRAVTVRLDLDLPDLSPVGVLLDAGEWGGSLAGEVSFEGSLPLLFGHADLVGTDVLLAGAPLGALEISLDADAERIVITRCIARSAEARVSLSGAWLIEEGALADVVLDLDVLEPELLRDLVAEGGHLTLRAEFTGTPDALTGRVTASGAELQFGGRTVHALDFAATAEDGVFDITSVHLTLDQGTIDGGLIVTLPRADRPFGVSLSMLDLVGDGASLALTGPVTMVIGDDRIALENLELTGDAGRIVVDFELAAERTRAHVTLEQLDPMPFLTGLLPDGVVVRGIDAVVEVEGDGNGWSASGSGRFGELRTPADDAAFDLVWRAALVDGRATIDELRATTDGVLVVDLSASMPLDPTAEQPLADGPIALTGRISLPPGRSLSLPLGERTITTSGALDVSLALGGTWRGVTGTIGLNGRSIMVDGGPDTRIFMPEPATVGIVLALHEDSVVVDRFSLAAPQRLEVDLEGSLGLPVDVIALSRQDFDWLATPFALTGSFSIADMSWVASLADSLRRFEGTATGRIDLGGTLGVPTGGAGFELRGGTLRLAGTPPIERLTIDARYADGTIELIEVSGELGAAPWTVTGRVSGLLDGAPSVALAVDGTNVLLSRTSSARMRADLALQVEGPLDALVVKGEVHLRNARVSQTIDFLGMLQGIGTSGGRSQQAGIAITPFEEGPLAACAFDIDLDTAEPIKIYSNVARGSVTVGLHIGGTGALIIPDGRIFLEPTRISLPSGTLLMQGGFIEWGEDNPLFPTLDMFGETRLLGYDISVSIRGRYDEPIVELSSVPPLARDELLVLLLTGNLPGGAIGTQAAQAVTVFLTKDLLARWADDGLDSDGESLTDRYEFITGRDVSKSGLLTMEATYKIREALLYDRDALFIVAERDRYEDYNIGLRFVLRFR